MISSNLYLLPVIVEKMLCSQGCKIVKGYIFVSHRVRLYEIVEVLDKGIEM